MYAYTHKHNCVYVWKTQEERDREMEMLMISRWQMVEWCSEDWYYCPLKLICCYSNPPTLLQGWTQCTLILSVTHPRALPLMHTLSDTQDSTQTSIWINKCKWTPFCLFKLHSSIIRGDLIYLSRVEYRAVVVSHALSCHRWYHAVRVRSSVIASFVMAIK